MIKKLLQSFSLAFQNIRSRLLHTFLSVLGIVIGVAALVGILSLIDGMEKYANAQISGTTSLNSILIQPQLQKKVDNVWVRKGNYSYLTYQDFKDLQTFLSSPEYGAIIRESSKELYIPGKQEAIGANVAWMATNSNDKIHLAYGHHFTENDIEEGKKVAIINKLLAQAVSGDTLYQKTLGKQIIVELDTLTIIGILAENNFIISSALLPITLLSSAELKAIPPYVFIEAEKLDDVAPLKEKLKDWVSNNHSSEDLHVVTNEFRLKQAEEGFLLFRIIMGMIVGISVLVGGIGVMNVLLISVTERTVEIGIRKAMGAKKIDIMLQFLSESVTIAAFGSLLGLLLGIASNFIFVPVIKSITKIPFQAAYTTNTLIIIAVVAVLTGIIFGTYPAMKAAKLDPVEAIRKE